MALQGELEFYAAGSGLPATATLAEHQAAFWRAQLPADAVTDTLTELEHAYYLQQLVLTRAEVPHLVDARLRYFRGLAGHDGAVNDLMVEAFAGGGPPPDVTNPTAGTLASSNITSTTFDLTVSGAADETALHAQPYRFSTDNGSTWSPYQTSPVFNVTGKTASTAYTCVHQTRDAAGNVSTGSSIVVNTLASGLTDGFVTVVSSVSNTTTYTFPAASLGTPDASRRVVLAVAGRDVPAIPTSVTIDVGGGPVALTLDIYEANTPVAYIYSAVIPTGATGDIVVTLPSGNTFCGVGIWALYGKDPVVGGVAEVTGNIAAMVMDVPTQAGDFVIGVGAYAVVATPGFVPTAADERYDGAVDGLLRCHFGLDKVATGATTQMGGTVTDYNGASVGVAQAYRAA